MTDIDVPDWVVEAANDVLADHARDGDGVAHEALKAALRAALSAWVVPVGVVSDAALERLRTVPDTWDDIFTLDGDVSDMTPLYKMRQEKPE